MNVRKQRTIFDGVRDYAGLMGKTTYGTLYIMTSEMISPIVEAITQFNCVVSAKVRATNESFLGPRTSQTAVFISTSIDLNLTTNARLPNAFHPKPQLAQFLSIHNVPPIKDEHWTSHHSSHKAPIQFFPLSTLFL